MIPRGTIPEDARALLPTMTPSEAVAHYGTSYNTVARWQRKLGVKCKPLSTERRAEIARHVTRTPRVIDKSTHDEPWHPDLFRAAMQAFNRAFGG